MNTHETKIAQSWYLGTKIAQLEPERSKLHKRDTWGTKIVQLEMGDQNCTIVIHERSKVFLDEYNFGASLIFLN